MSLVSHYNISIACCEHESIKAKLFLLACGARSAISPDILATDELDAANLLCVNQDIFSSCTT